MRNGAIDLVYFSWTGTTKRVFEFISSWLTRRGYQVSLKEIKPLRNHSYYFWLLLSFIPSFSVKIEPLVVEADVVFLGTPKWTLNCPPFTSFLRDAELSDKKVFLVLVYGGFDEKRYARVLSSKIQRKGGRVIETILVKRKKVENNEFEEDLADVLNKSF
jgi:flavodoxin